MLDQMFDSRLCAGVSGIGRHREPGRWGRQIWHRGRPRKPMGEVTIDHLLTDLSMLAHRCVQAMGAGLTPAESKLRPDPDCAAGRVQPRNLNVDIAAGRPSRQPDIRRTLCDEQRTTEGTMAVTVADVRTALATVKDPEIRRPITELGMVGELSVERRRGGRADGASDDRRLSAAGHPDKGRHRSGTGGARRHRPEVARSA